MNLKLDANVGMLELNESKYQRNIHFSPMVPNLLFTTTALPSQLLAPSNSFTSVLRQWNPHKRLKC